MNINRITKLQKKIKKMIFLTIIILSPYVSNAQLFGNGPCHIMDSVILEGFCWDPILATGTITIVPDAIIPIYNYALNADTVWAYDSLGVLYNNASDSVFLVSAGTYTIWLQEANNPSCFDTITITVPDPQDSITTVTNVSQNLICHGDSTGGGEVNAIGGVLPYTYFWESTGATTNIVSNLWVGYHNVFITDANGCVVVDSVLIENIYDALSVDLDTIQQVQCYGEDNGEVILNVTRGVAPYTFNWSTGQNYFGPGPDTLSGLWQGGYQVLIADAYGCDTVVSFIISEPSQLYAAAYSIQPVQCFGFDDGQAYVIGTGGTGTGNPDDYTYSWGFIQNFLTPTADTLSSGVINDTTMDASGDPDLVPGVHYVTITDTNGCTASDTVTITEPTQLYVEIPDSSAIYSYCLNTYSGTLVAEAYGGTPFSAGAPYSYSWDNTVQLTDSVVGLHAGIYTVTVFDDRACTASATFDLDSITNTFIDDSVDVIVANVSCYALYDGLININGISGSDYPPYNYTWTGPLPFISSNSALVDGLYEGNYAVTIVDSLGCTMLVNVDIYQPDKLEFGVTYTVNESCVGVTGSACNGSIILNINGGTSPYFYDNSFSGAFPILVNNQVLVVNDTLMSGFCNGTYIIDVTDVNGCQGYVDFGASFTATVGSDVQVVNPGVNPLLPTTSCFNTADGVAGVFGGADPIFNYTWESDDSGAPSGLVLGANTPYNNFLVGNYWLVAHYADSLSFGINYAVCDVPYNFSVAPGNMINFGAVVTNPTCYGDSNGSINLNLSSSTAPPFTFLWDTLTSIPVTNYAFEDQLQLGPGIYTVSITDDDGCVLVESFLVNEPSPIIANFTIQDVSCNGYSDGEVTVDVDLNSGQSPFTYSWSDGQTVNQAMGLLGGDYIVTVTDSGGLGCSVDFNVTVIDPSSILASVEANSFWGQDDFGNPFHISCYEESNGSIIVGSVGGTGIVTFAWENSMGITVSTLQETGPTLPVGSYTLYATDENGCQEDTTIILNEPDLISPNVTVLLYDFNADGIGTEASCFGLFDGWASSSPSGGYPGVQGYSFNWVNSNGQNISSQALAANLPALLSYTVTVTDMNGCSNDTTTAVFTQPLLFDANVTTTNYAGAIHAPFSINFVDSTISIDPFDFNWNWEDGTDYFANGTSTFNHLFSVENIGENNVHVILTNLTTGCFDSVHFVIDVQGIPEINNVFTPNSDGINDEFYFGEFGMSTVSVEVYNRWGQMVYTWNGTDKSWAGVDISGEFVPEGVYFYTLVAEGEDGHYYDKKGSVTLLR
jgi:gliding motility-associated-like protein